MALKRIVVTGGTGFVGSRVLDACHAAGMEAVSCSRREGVDLRDRSATASFLAECRPDAVVHCAAHVGGLGYVAAHGVEVFEDNLRIAMGLLGGMQEAGVDQLIAVMPNCTYPGEADVYREDEWWDGPIHDSVLMYGLPRKALWGLAKTYGDAFGLRSLSLIYPNLYGPGDHLEPHRSHALGALAGKIVAAQTEGRDSVELWGTGKPVREWMYVDDAAESIVALLRCAHRDPTVLDGHPIFNVGIGAGVSIIELAEMIAESAGWQGRFTLCPERPDGAAIKTLDGSRFGTLTGWRPRMTLREGIRRTIAWYQEALQELAHVD